MKPLILLDLDRTLFDTTQYVDDLPSLLAQHSLKTVSEIRDYMPTMLNGERHKLHRADYADFVEFLGMSMNEFTEVVLAEANLNTYLYKDAQALIDWLTDKGSVFEILTFGDPVVQNLKLSITPALVNIPFTVVDSLKKDYIEAHLSGRTGCLIDDKPDQQLPVDWTEIHIDRKAPNHFSPRKVSEHVWQISTLTDAPEIIESLHIANN